MNNVVGFTNSEHYNWGDQCEGWHFLKTEALSIIREKMPSLTEEKLHLHNSAKQFFYILSGCANFEIDGVDYVVKKDEGIFIEAGQKHKIINKTNLDLDFIVFSCPKSHGDRTNIE